MITRADKGNAAVIEKTENLFKDKKYYKEINTNPLPSLERKTNELTKKLNIWILLETVKSYPECYKTFLFLKHMV